MNEVLVIYALVLVVALIVSGLIGMLIWSSHGFFWGFWLGPIGWTIAAILSVREEVQQKNISFPSSFLKRQIAASNDIFVIMNNLNSLKKDLELIDEHICESMNWTCDALKTIANSMPVSNSSQS